MIERRKLPISIAELHSRIRIIPDPLKRAEAQAFAGVYAPVLRNPENYTPGEIQQQRSFALRAKKIINPDIPSPVINPPEENFPDYRSIDAIAEEFGFRGIDMLMLPTVITNRLASFNV